MTRPQQGQHVWAAAVVVVVVMIHAAALPAFSPLLRRHYGHSPIAESPRARSRPGVARGYGVTGSRGPPAAAAAAVTAAAPKDPLSIPKPTTYTADEELLFTDILEHLDLEPLDARDPRMTGSGGLKMASHSGKDLVFTKDTKGMVSVNGQPVEDKVALKDGTEVYTLERFLEENKNRLDEAFDFLSRQMETSETQQVSTNVPADDTSIQQVSPSSVEPQDDAPQFSVFIRQVTEISLVTSAAETTTLQPPTTTESVTESPDYNVPTTAVSSTQTPVTQIFTDPSTAETLATDIPTSELPTTEAISSLATFESHFVEVSPATTEPLEISTVPSDNLEPITQTSFTVSFGETFSETRSQSTSPLNPETQKPLDQIAPLKDPEQHLFSSEIEEAKSLSPVFENSSSTSIETTTVMPLEESDILTTTEISRESSTDFTLTMSVSVETHKDSQSERKAATESSKGTATSLEATRGSVTIQKAPSVVAIPESAGEGKSDINVSVLQATSKGQDTDTEQTDPEHQTKAQKNADANMPVVEAHSPQVSPAIEGDALQLKDEIKEAMRKVIVSVTEERRSDSGFPSAKTEHSSHPSRGESEAASQSPGSVSVTVTFEDSGPATDSSRDTKVTAEGVRSKVPAVPRVVEAWDGSSLLSLWRHALSKQEQHYAPSEHEQVPRTILSPNPTVMLDLVPQDAFHPLYHDSDHHQDLRSHFLLDYFLPVSISASDPRISRPEGLTVTNLAGRQLTFRRNAKGVMMVNGVRAQDWLTLADGTETYTLEGLLFDHRARIDEAFQELVNQPKTPHLSGGHLVVSVGGSHVSLADDSHSLEGQALFSDRTFTMHEANGPITNHEIHLDAPNPAIPIIQQEHADRSFSSNPPQSDQVTKEVIKAPQIEAELPSEQILQVHVPWTKQVWLDETVVLEAKDELPVFKAESPVARVEVSEAVYPRVEVRVPLAKIVPPMAEVRVPAVEIVPPMAEVVLPAIRVTLAEDKIAMDENMPPLVKSKVPSTEMETPIAESVPQVSAMLVPMAETMPPQAEGRVLPVVNTMSPVASEGASVGEAVTLVDEMEVPLTTEIVPVTRVEVYVAEAISPITEVEVPITEILSPVGEMKVPITKILSPLDEMKVPISKILSPVAEIEVVPMTETVSPVAEVEVPTAETLSPVEIPTTETFYAVAEMVAPITETFSPVAEVEAPITEAWSPVAEVEAPMTETFSPVAEVEAPITEVWSPVAEVEAPMTETFSPVAEVEDPITEAWSPVAEVEAPMTETFSLVAEVEVPMTETWSPVAEVEDPITEAWSPVAEVEAPMTETFSPVAEVEDPITEAWSPVAEVIDPMTQTFSSVAEVEAPMTETWSPVAETWSPMTETWSPVTEGKVPSAETLSPVAEVGVPVTEVEFSVADMEMPGSEVEVPIVRMEMSLADVEESLATNVFPAGQKEVSLVEVDVPLIDVKIPVYDVVIQDATVDVPLLIVEVPVTEVEDPVVKGKVPVVEVEIQMVEAKVPVDESVASVAEVRVPVLELVPPMAMDLPMTEAEVSLAELEESLTESVSPVVEEEVSITQTVLPWGQEEILVSGVEGLVDEAEYPPTEMEVPVTETLSSLAEVQGPLATDPASVTETPRNEVEVPLGEVEMPVPERRVPVAGVKVSLDEPMSPAVRFEVPVAEIMVPKPKGEDPLADMEILVDEAVASAGEAEVSVPEVRVSLNEPLPSVNLEVPLAKTVTPVDKVEVHLLEVEAPIAEAIDLGDEEQVPVAEPVASMAETVRPVAKDLSVIETKVSMAEMEGFLPKDVFSVAELELPVAEMEDSFTENVSPALEIEVPMVQAVLPEGEEEILVAGVNVPIADAVSPPAEMEVSMLENVSPLLEEQVPLNPVTVSVVEAASPAAEVEGPLAEIDISVVEVDALLAGMEVPVAKVEAPIAEGEVSPAEEEIPLVEPNSPTAELETSVTETVSPVAEIKIPVVELSIDNVEVPVAEMEVLVAEVEEPLDGVVDPINELEVPFPSDVAFVVDSTRSQDESVIPRDGSLVQSVEPVLAVLGPGSVSPNGEEEAALIHQSPDVISMLELTPEKESQVPHIPQELSEIHDPEVKAGVEVSADRGTDAIIDASLVLTRIDSHIPTPEGVLSGNPRLTVPEIPKLVKEEEASSLLNIWRHALFLQSQTAGILRTGAEVIPQTVLSPPPFKVTNLVPKDGPHPLYSDDLENSALRTEFLLDYLLQDPVSVYDARIASPEGFSITNMAGKSLVFKINDRGRLTINGVKVKGVRFFADGTQVISLADFLFDHQARVDEALQRLNSQPSRFGPLGQPLEVPVPEIAEEVLPITSGGHLAVVPPIPTQVEESRTTTLLDLWRHALWSQQASSGARTDLPAPRTVLSPHILSAVNLVPQDTQHPLLQDAPENVALRDEILLDYLVQDPVSSLNVRITQPGGLAATNLAGHRLTFEADDAGSFTVNGVPVKGAFVLPDGTHVFTLAGLLFDHAARVDQAFHRLTPTLSSTPQPPPVLLGHAPAFPQPHSPPTSGIASPHRV